MSFLSVVVTTYKRESVLRTTLDRLGNQTLDRAKYEVIVVDDESPDGTEAMVRDYIKRADFAVRYLRHTNRGPGHTENRGIYESRGPWVLLMADDIHATPRLLEEIYLAHCENPEPQVAVAGKVIESPDLPETVFHRHWDLFQYDRFDGMRELPPVAFWGCCISVKRDFLLNHGMFIEHSMPAHEDTELGWRLAKAAGLRIVYRPAALAHHYHAMDIDAACRQFYSRGENFHGLADHSTDPALYVLTETVTWKTLPYFFKALRGNLSGLDISKVHVARILAGHAIRKTLFNSVTAPRFFVPLIRAAERNRLLACMISNRLLRWTISAYFTMGLRDLRRRRRKDAERGPLPI